jgi:hypothetical protein
MNKVVAGAIIGCLLGAGVASPALADDDATYQFKVLSESHSSFGGPPVPGPLSPGSIIALITLEKKAVQAGTATMAGRDIESWGLASGIINAPFIQYPFPAELANYDSVTFNLNLQNGELSGSIDFVEVVKDGCTLHMTGTDGNWSGTYGCPIPYEVFSFTAAAERAHKHITTR